MKLIQTKHLLILIITGGIYLLCLPLQPSVDALSARYDFRYGRNNWFGSISEFVYGVTPGGEKYWTYTLSLTQLALFSIGLILVLQRVNLPKPTFVLMIVFGEVFSICLVRDALAFSILMFSLGLISTGFRFFTLLQRIYLFLGFLLMSLALSIRPHYGIAFIFFYFALARRFGLKRLGTTVLTGVLITMPFVIDAGFSKILNQKNVFPAQQIIIFDIAQMACWSSNDSVRTEAKIALSSLKNPNHYGSLCEVLKPYNWQFMVLGDSMGIGGPLRKLQINDAEIFNNLLKDYTYLFLKRPDEFVKIKLRNLNELMFVNGQFDGVGKSKSPISYMLKIIDKLHLFSWVILLPFISYYFLQNWLKTRSWKISRPKLSDNIFISGLLIVPISAVCYVGAIGRYTVTASYLMVLGLLVARYSESAE